MIKEWKSGVVVLLYIGLALATGTVVEGLLWGFVVVIPEELLSDDARWLERYVLHAAVIGAGTYGVRTIGQMSLRGELTGLTMD